MAQDGQSAIVKTVLAHPISALNMALLVIGGTTAFVTRDRDLQDLSKAQSENLRRFEQIDKKMTDLGSREDGRDVSVRSLIAEVDRKADAKLELIQRDVSDLKSTVRAIDTNIQWIVRSQGGNPAPGQSR